MKIPLYQVDAFTDRPFAGNPAAVCPLPRWLPDATLQAVAAENNLSETAFFVPEGDGYTLRWFTPAREVELCGHATLASALVVFQFLQPGARSVRFTSPHSGRLPVDREGELLVLDFPARPPQPCDPPPDLARALGRQPGAVLLQRDYFAVFEREAEVRALRPDRAALLELPVQGVAATAPGDDCDFVSRYFVPSAGIDEDPVTGSTHCVLAPYWAARLGRPKLRARQVSARGGELQCELRGGRVRIGGRAVLVVEGQLLLPD